MMRKCWGDKVSRGGKGEEEIGWGGGCRRE